MKFIYLILIISFLFSCKSNNSEKDISNKINIDIKNALPFKDWANMVNNTMFTPLVSPDEPIGIISKITFTKNDFYCFDKQTQSILRFGKDAVLKNRFNFVGNGPGEYTRAFDFELDHATGKMYLLTGAIPNEVMIYDSAGLFLDKIKLEQHGTFILKTNKHLYLSRSNFSSRSDTLNNKVFVFSESGKLENSILPENPNLRGLLTAFKSSFQMNNGKIYYLNSFENDIYQQVGSEFKKFISFDMGSYWASNKDILRLGRGYSVVQKLKKMEKVVYLDYSINDNHIVLDFRVKDQSYLSILDLSKNKSVTYKFPFNKTTFWNTYKNQFITIVLPEIMTEDTKKENKITQRVLGVRKSCVVFIQLDLSSQNKKLIPHLSSHFFL